jgi:hypothetical protein
MLFCPNCDNILNISKNPPKNNLGAINNTSTPNTVSDSDSEKERDDENIRQNELFEEVINKLLAGEVVSDSALTEINSTQLIKNKAFQKLDKKQKSLIQSKLASFTEKLDDATNAYYFCKNCMYSKIIEAGSLIVSRVGGSKDLTTTKYVNFNKLKNRIHSKSLPITRNYICINDKCDTHKTDKNKKDKEAVFYRLGTSMQVWYTCKACGSYWQGE